MLRVADRAVEQDFDVLPSEPVVPISRHPSVGPQAVTLSSRYGERRSPNWLVIALILIAHAVLITAIMQARQAAQRREEARLSVVNLTPPPPPPEEQTPPPPPSTPKVVAPPPIVQVPVPQPVKVATTPEPSPSVPTTRTIIAPPAPVAVTAAAPSIVQGGDLSAQMVAGKPPRYPIESRRKREQGTVVLALTLGTDGAVESVVVAHSSGFSRLDDAARDAVRRWRWRPTIQQGQPVRVKGVVEIPFVIQVAAT
ncbi:MAG TPA: energy transducer TonB [Sphingobium sp.]